jgi:hypothetical protein
MHGGKLFLLLLLLHQHELLACQAHKVPATAAADAISNISPSLEEHQTVPTVTRTRTWYRVFCMGDHLAISVGMTGCQAVSSTSL